MTPEERARHTGVCHVDRCEGFCHCFDRIVSAIRSAENEALERAAKMADERLVIGEDIRAMKHPEDE